MEDKIITLKVKHNLDDVAEKVDKVGDKLEEVDDKVDEIADSTKKAETGIGKMSKAFTGLGLAIKAAGIGILLDAFQVFKDVMMSNQKVLDLFNTSMTATKNIFADVVRLITGDLSFKKFVDNLGKSWEKATDTTKLENNAKRAAVIQQGLIEKYDRLAELQRQIRDGENNSLPQRIKANERLGQILKLQNAEMQKQAKYQLEAAKIRYNSNPNIENEIALLEARNNQSAIAAQVTGLESEQLININTLLNEVKTKKEELKQKNEEERLSEIAKLDSRLAAIRTYEANIAAEEIDAETERKKRAAEKQAQIELENNAELNSMALYEANLTAEAKKYGDERKENAKKERLEKIDHLNAYADASMAIGQLLGQQTAQGKALAIAASLISTYAAIAKQLEAFAGVPVPGYAIAQAIATGAVGLAQVANIASVNLGPYSGDLAMSNTPSAPRFNVVGASPFNQAAQLMNREQAPIKTYVLSSDVSSAQALDRNKITSATLG
jgi:hypothetical protein